MPIGKYANLKLNDGLASREELSEAFSYDPTPKFDLPFIFGTSGRDNIKGTDNIDWIIAQDGNDTVYAKDGDDSVFGNNGSDRLYGQGGNDRLDGGLDEDHLDGGDDDDILIGGSHDDVLLGGDGDDHLNGDFVDWTGDGEGDDTLHGGAGNDTILGRGGDDYITGGSGEDTIRGGTGDDTMWGEGRPSEELPPYAPEADVFVFAENRWGDDTIMDFDDGLDLIDFSQHQHIAGMADITIAQVGTDTVISYVHPQTGPFGPGPQTSTITLVGIDVGDINADDFIF